MGDDPVSTYAPDFEQWNDQVSEEGLWTTVVVWRVPCTHNQTYYKPFVYAGHDRTMTSEDLDYMRDVADEEVRAQGFEPR
jgi:hypothetical protein